jgi:hypothetical protein
MIGVGGWVMPLLTYTLAFALQLRKITESLSQGSRVVRNQVLSPELVSDIGNSWTR